MNNMPKKLREQLSKDPEYKQCARKSVYCRGRITFEHALYHQGKQLQEPWAIVPLCEFHHLGEGLNKRFNEWYALRKGFQQEAYIKEKYPRAHKHWKQRLNYLNKIFDETL